MRQPLNLMLWDGDTGNMQADSTDKRRSFLGALATGLRALATKTGCTLSRHPMPELREVGHEWRKAAARANG